MKRPLSGTISFAIAVIAWSLDLFFVVSLTQVTPVLNDIAIWLGHYFVPFTLSTTLLSLAGIVIGWRAIRQSGDSQFMPIMGTGLCAMLFLFQLIAFFVIAIFRYLNPGLG